MPAQLGSVSMTLGCENHSLFVHERFSEVCPGPCPVSQWPPSLEGRNFTQFLQRLIECEDVYQILLDQFRYCYGIDLAHQLGQTNPDA